MDGPKRFLSLIWGVNAIERPGYGELRAFRPEGKPKQLFVPLSFEGLDQAVAFAQKEGETKDVYFGVMPRKEKKGTSDSVFDATSVLWADVDAKAFAADTRIGKALALARLNRAIPKPQIIIDSGGGYHAYWILDRPVPYILAREAMKWIADVVKGDHVQDAARIMRLPWTFNRKRPEAVMARFLLWDEGRLIRWPDIEILAPVPEPAVRRFVTPLKNLSIDEIPDWLMDLIKEGAPKGQRSELAFKVVLWLLRYGFTREQIEEVFAAYPDGVGSKYAEQGPRWLNYTLDAAERVA